MPKYNKKDKWNPDLIDKDKANDLLDRINKADPEQPNHIETPVQGYVKWLRKGVKYGDIWMYRDWDGLRGYAEDQPIMLALVDALGDVLMLDKLRIDVARLHSEVRERVDQIERNKKGT